MRQDAQRKTNNLSPVSASVVASILYTREFWPLLEQLLLTIKPLVDAIGNLESREANLADCTLEFISCARDMAQLYRKAPQNSGLATIDSTWIPDDGNPPYCYEFDIHARATFNQRFHSMITPIHSLALFLHPLCRNLAVSNAANGRSFNFICKTALSIAKQWKWSKPKTEQLLANLKEYIQLKGPFTGGEPDSLSWWENLTVRSNEYPLKAFAIAILKIVPHAAEVERFFSHLGGVQSPKRCNLTVPHFEAIGQCRANYTYHLWKRDKILGYSMHRAHAHMHTRPEPGIDAELAEKLERSFSFQPPLASIPDSVDSANIEGPESISMAELEAAFDDAEQGLAEDLAANSDLTGQPLPTPEVLNGAIYNFTELENVSRGTVGRATDNIMEVIRGEGNSSESWDEAALLAQAGI